MLEVKAKTITVKIDQHEAIVRMKRGSDTIYDVVDRLLDNHINLDDSITQLDTAMEDLESQMFLLRAAVVELRGVLNGQKMG
jgi:predicted CopG family antitoxin